MPHRANCFLNTQFGINTIEQKTMTPYTFDFRGTSMTVKISSECAAGHYTVIEMNHPPLVGPALHIHPTHPESFYVLEGEYTFYRGGEIIEAKAGDCVSIPPGTPHRYKVGNKCGRVIVLSPPTLERYFKAVSERIASGGITLEEEKEIASRHGQHFLDMSAHWEPK